MIHPMEEFVLPAVAEELCGRAIHHGERTEPDPRWPEACMCGRRSYFHCPEYATEDSWGGWVFTVPGGLEAS